MNRDRVAVFIRGMHRTWPHIRAHTLYLFDQLFGVDKVDWYVAMWDTIPQLATDYINIGFNGRNLIFCNAIPLGVYPLSSVPEIKYQTTLPHYQKWKGYRSGYWNIAYLDSLLISKKVEYELEHNFYYDRVFFIRPDIYYKCHSFDAIRKPLNDFEIDGLQYYNIQGNLATDDLYYQTTSITADVLCSRFLDTYTKFDIKQLMPQCPHALMGQFVNRNCLTPIGVDNSVELVIVRPDVLDKINNIVQLDNTSWQSWNRLDDQTRAMYCQQHNINPIEYGI